ncbi:MAG: ankyrin repeat domain-containing protein, partial [Thermoanaerobaculia bacterium]|nr:ankyrin repeat domain-containing protein [Thermoanaerobaculia bacterium]
AQTLLDVGADPDGVNRNTAFPLGLACSNGNPSMVRRLLRAGADPRAAPGGEPPLLTCARSGSSEAVGRLLEAGAPIDAVDGWRGQTALMWAAAEDHADVVELLLARGADVAAATERGFDALGFAVRQGAHETVRILIAAGADVNRAAPDGRSLLQVAIRNHHFSIGRTLLASGADPDAADKQGRTALHDLVAAREPTRLHRAPGDRDPLPSLELMRDVLAAGADPNPRTAEAPRLSDKLVPSSIRPIIDNAINTGGATPLLLAAKAADVAAMEVLLEGGADPQLRTHGGTSALMFATGLVFVEGSRNFRPEQDYLAAVRLALAAGVDPNVANEHGQTALHGAVYRASNEIIEELVAAGARTDLEDELGRTPLELAEQGFNQISSIIRRDEAAELLRRLTPESERDDADAAPALGFRRPVEMEVRE